MKLDEPFAWHEVMAFGLGVLKMTPDAFWRSTPREIAAAMHAFDNANPQPADRTAMKELMAEFPDIQKSKEQTNQ